MSTTAKPIVATTTLSFLLHGMAFAGLFMFYDYVEMDAEGVGRGVEIQLISSLSISDQNETDVPEKSETSAEVVTEPLNESVPKQAAVKVLTSLATDQTPVVTAPVDDAIKNHKAEQQKPLIVDKGESKAQIMQSTNAAQQTHNILELLHQRISDNKEYPYLARRQRREGIATVSFVLHPDGRVENAHLVISTRAEILDHAALSAVKKIEPFAVAQQYLKQPEEFRVNVEFDLL